MKWGQLLSVGRSTVESEDWPTVQRWIIEGFERDARTGAGREGYLLAGPASMDVMDPRDNPFRFEDEDPDVLRLRLSVPIAEVVAA